jgi:hypothetical protein
MNGKGGNPTPKYSSVQGESHTRNLGSIEVILPRDLLENNTNFRLLASQGHCAIELVMMCVV